jgi:hypothetical protein
MLEEASKWTDYVPFTVDTKVGQSWGTLSKIINRNQQLQTPQVDKEMDA